MTLDLAAFPPDFQWGASTSAYQIEGATTVDGRSPCIWDTYCAQPGTISDASNGDPACDHYRRWPEDIALMREMNLGGYRFSIAWPRVLPDGTGRVNDAGLDFYDRLVDGLLEAGIEPMPTLYHWDLPQALEDAGGWPERHLADAFAEYADVVTRRLGDRVRSWLTLNEPWVAAWHGYGNGYHAPGRSDAAGWLAASHTMLRAHGLGMQAIRANVPSARAGIALNLIPAVPADAASEADVAAARRFDGFVNRWFLDPLYGKGYPEDMLEHYGDDAPRVEDGDLELAAAPTELLGVNYYSVAYVTDDERADNPVAAHEVKPEGEYTEMNWIVQPDGLYELLTRLHREYAPTELVVTENGAAMPDEVSADGSVHDERRRRYIERHLDAGIRAIRDGAPLTGWYAWSLMDNFEWGFGYEKRFGLVRVDYDTQQRTIKDSARWYADTIASARAAQLAGTSS